MLEVIAEDGGSQRQHRQRLRKLLETTKGPARIASAYITDTALLSGIKSRKARLLISLLRMDIVSGATSLESLRSLIEAGVQCRYLSNGPRFHAKVYIFGDESAVVTSANLTGNGLDSNIEVGILLSGSAVHELTVWFDAFWAKAGQLDLEKVSKLQQETAALRREYAVLRKKASAMPTLPNEALPSVRLPEELRDLLDNANRFFVCNTNRRWSRDVEEQMRRRSYAAAWEEFKYPTHMDQVEQDNAIFMFAKGVGIIGIGRARAPREILEPSDADRIENGDTREWRVPVDWLAWVEEDVDSFSWHSPYPTFFDVSGDKYRELRQGVRKHFLGHS